MGAEFEQILSSYLDETISLDQIYDWLAENAQTLSDDDAPEVRRLYGRMWTLLSEYDSGHRSEASLRAELSQCLAALRLSLSGWHDAVAREFEPFENSVWISVFRVSMGTNGPRPNSTAVDWQCGDIILPLPRVGPSAPVIRHEL